MTKSRFQQKAENLNFAMLILGKKVCYISRGTVS